MKVIVAEKPSVAKDIASCLGANSRNDGYFEGNGYQVTWAFGHLVSLQEPHEYDLALKKWSLATLPFIPKTFQLKLVEGNGISKQFSTIKRLIKASSELICATDAGREGELIFRYILSLAGCEKKPFQRLWLSSLTDEAIKKAFAHLRPGSDYNNLYAAAKCRSEADWIVGLNATRNFTVRYGRGDILWTVGRVQTPVLAMIVQRDDMIRHFVSEPFWELKTTYRGVIFKYKGDRFTKEIDAQKILALVKENLFAVKSVDSKQEKTYSPSLFDLTDLQREMNKRFGISANETLQIAQTLYEQKIITYPRTDSKFLGSDMKGEIPKILHQLKELKPQEIGSLNLNDLPLTNRVINDKKTGEHHAIIPTGKHPRNLALPSQHVFDAILTRFIAVFYPCCIKEITTVVGISNQISFQAKGVQVITPGWTILYPKASSDTEKAKEEEQELPQFIADESGPHSPFIKQGKTEPPRHFTEGTLLSAMETAGKLVDDEQLKEALKQNGLGTPATRASIIEILIKRNYITRDKKNLMATNHGRYLIALIQDPQLKSPELTGEWESKLKQIEQGQMQAEPFMEAIKCYTGDIIRKSDSSNIDDRHFGACPLCQKAIIEGKRGYGCSGWREGCKFVLWKEYKNVLLSAEQARHLIQRKILLQPLNLASGRVVLCLSQKGILMEIPVPESQAKKPQKR